MSEATSLGVRQLRQNLSGYLRRVQRGERLRVTDHGRLVAILAPPSAAVSALDRMIADGRATPARGDLLELGPPPPAPKGEPPLSRWLEISRRDRL